MDFENDLIPFWNRKTLEPPALISLRIKTKNPVQTSAKLAMEFNNILSVLENQELLKFEAALISRLLYRTKKLLRNDKGYKGFQKINKLLKNYLLLNVSKIVSENRSRTTNDKGPSREMFQWFLISLQRFAGLIHRLENTCVYTGYYMYNRIKTGDRWHLGMLFMACISRIWTLSRYLLPLACEWYSQLKMYLDCLESKEQWLPLGHELPEDLRSWLGNPDFAVKQNREEILVEEPTTSNTTEKPSRVSAFLFNEDFGEIISRDSGAVGTANQKNDRINKRKDTSQSKREEKFDKRRKIHSSDEQEWEQANNFLNKSLNQLNSARDKKIVNESMNRARKKFKSWRQN